MNVIMLPSKYIVGINWYLEVFRIAPGIWQDYIDLYSCYYIVINFLYSVILGY